MNADEKEKTEKPEQSDESKEKTEKPELSDEGKEKVDAMRQTYDDDRPTAVLPGTGGTITGVAVNEWLDDDGNPKFGKDEEKKRNDEQDQEHDEN